MTTETLVVTQDETTLDLLLWRRFRALPAGIVERALDLNQGLADMGAFIPIGTHVLVERPSPAGMRSVPLVTLWD